MSRLKIINGTDRLEFAHSLFSWIEGSPAPGMMVPSRFAGGIDPPINCGVPFVVEEDEKERTINLIICGSKRKGRVGYLQEFTAVAWREESSVINQYPWIYYRGEYDFQSSTGWIEEYNPEENPNSSLEKE